MKMQQSPSISPTPLFNLGEFQPFLKLVLFFFSPPSQCTTHLFRADLTLVHFFFFFFHIILPPGPLTSHTLLSPDWFISPVPSPPPPPTPLTLSFQLNQGLTAPCCLKKKKIENLPLYIPVQSGPAVSCPCLSCRGRRCHASEVKLCQQGWKIPKATGLCDNKTSMVYLFFIQIDEISIFWLTTDNFQFRILFSGALMFFFFF